MAKAQLNLASALRALVQRLPFVHPKPEELQAEQHAKARSAADLMVDTTVVADDAPVREAIVAMLGGKHKIVAVVDAQKRLVGVVDRADLLHGLVSSTPSEKSLEGDAARMVDRKPCRDCS